MKNRAIAILISFILLVLGTVSCDTADKSTSENTTNNKADTNNNETNSSKEEENKTNTSKSETNKSTTENNTNQSATNDNTTTGVPNAAKDPSIKEEVPQVEDRTPTTSNKTPVTDNKQPSTENKAPTTNNKTQVTENKAPTTNNKTQVTENKAPTIQEQTPTIDAPKQETSSTMFMDQVESMIFAKVNQERAKAGVAALTYNKTMEKYARIKSQDMGDRGYFSHNDPEGRLITDKMRSDGVTYKAWGENIAYIGGVSDPTALANQFMTNWMNSQGHRENILSTNFTSIGVGVYKIGKTVYATQQFSK